MHATLTYTINRETGTVTLNGVVLDEADLLAILADLQQVSE